MEQGTVYDEIVNNPSRIGHEACGARAENAKVGPVTGQMDSHVRGLDVEVTCKKQRYGVGIPITKHFIEKSQGDRRAGHVTVQGAQTYLPQSWQGGTKNEEARRQRSITRDGNR
jgi:hypothetical protein